MITIYSLLHRQQLLLLLNVCQLIVLYLIVEYLQVLNKVPNTHVKNRSNRHEKTRVEIDFIAEGLAIVQPTIPFSSTRLAPQDAAPIQDSSEKYGRRDEREQTYHHRGQAHRHWFIFLADTPEEKNEMRVQLAASEMRQIK